MNLICEHCLVSAFVDQHKLVTTNVVDAVARDFDLGDNTTSQAVTTPPRATTPLSSAGGEKFDLIEALQL